MEGGGVVEHLIYIVSDPISNDFLKKDLSNDVIFRRLLTHHTKITLAVQTTSAV